MASDPFKIQPDGSALYDLGNGTFIYSPPDAGPHQPGDQSQVKVVDASGNAVPGFDNASALQLQSQYEGAGATYGTHEPGTGAPLNSVGNAAGGFVLGAGAGFLWGGPAGAAIGAGAGAVDGWKAGSNGTTIANQIEGEANKIYGSIPGSTPAGGGGGSGGGGTGGGGGGGGTDPLVGAVNNVATEAQGYASQNRDFQLTGLDKSNQAFQPSQQSYAGMYGPGGTQTGPGQGEQAFSNVGSALLNPSAQSGVLAQTSGYLGGQAPGMTALGQVAGQLGGPTLSSQQYGNYASQLAAPSNSQQSYQALSGQLAQPSLSQQSYGQYASALGTPSAGEQRYQQTQGQYNSNPLQQQMGSLDAKYDAPTNLQSSLGSIQAGYQKPSNAQGSYATQQQQLSGPGALEQFAASDLNGTNPYYKQLQDTQAANIDAEFNARGGYNSGAAMKAQALGASNLAAQQYQQEGQLQGQAQSAQSQRLGQLQSGASSADSSNYAALSGQTGALSTADAQRLAATNGQVGLAGAASGMNLSYLQGGQGAANSAGSADLARTQAGIGLAQGTDATNLSRIQATGQLANSSDAANLAKTQAGIGLTQGTDATNLAQNLGYVGAANAAGAGQTSQYSTYGNLAQGADATTQAQLNAYLNQAGAAQGLTQGREQTGYADALGMGTAQAGNTLTAYNNAGNQNASMLDASMGAQLNAAQLQAQLNAQGQQNTLAYYQLLANLYSSGKGGTAYLPSAPPSTGYASMNGTETPAQSDYNDGTYPTGANGAPIIP